MLISSISLFLQQAASSLAQALLKPSKLKWHRLFLLNASIVFVNAEKCSVQNRVVFIKTITYSTRFDNVNAKSFVKTVDFRVFPV